MALPEKYTVDQLQAMLMDREAYNAVLFTLFSIAMVTTAARFASRIFQLKAWGYDDSLVLLATVFTVVYVAVEHVRSDYIYQLSELIINSNLQSLKRILGLMELILQHVLPLFILHNWILCTLKLSIISFFLRIVSSRKQRYTLYFVVGVILIWMAVHFVLCFIQIIPFKALFYPITYRGAKKRLITMRSIQIAKSSSHLFFDILLMLLPIHVLLTLKTTRHVKVVLTIIYSFGTLSLAATILRLVQTIKYIRNNDVAATLRNPSLSCWVYAEIFTVFICANIPALFAAVQKSQFGKSFSLSSLFSKRLNRSATIRPLAGVIRSGTREKSNRYGSDASTFNFDDSYLSRTELTRNDSLYDSRRRPETIDYRTSSERISSNDDDTLRVQIMRSTDLEQNITHI